MKGKGIKSTTHWLNLHDGMSPSRANLLDDISRKVKRQRTLGAEQNKSSSLIRMVGDW